ncbi:MAG: glycosyl transferase family 2, partial [Pirellulales bacterium]
PGVVSGCFRQTIESDRPIYRLLEWANFMRVRCTGLAYGDQGIFVRRALFLREGGFPALALMEDLFLMRRLRQRGRIVILPCRVHVSARRWKQAGVVRQTLRNLIFTALAFSGVHPDRLARYYPHLR